MPDEVFIKFINKVIKEYKNILGLNLYNIDIENDEQYYLALRFNYPYQDTTIYYSKKAVKDFSDGKIDKYRILHELCHILTDPLYAKSTERFVSKNELEDEREKLTDKMSLIIKNLEEK